MNHSIKRRICALLLTLVLLATMLPVSLADEEEGGEAPPASETTYTVKSVSVTPSTVPELKIGATQTLNAEVTVTVKTATEEKEVTYSASSHADMPEDLEITWTVTEGRKGEVLVTYDRLNPFTATATALAVAASNADPKAVYVTVAAQIGDRLQTQSCGITVISSEKPGISISQPTLDLAPNSTGQLTAAVTPETADQTIAWTSADPNIAMVVPTGTRQTATITAGSSAGQTTITATSSAGLQASCTVTVLGIVLNEHNLTLRTGNNYTLTYTIYGDSLKSRGVTWSSSNEKVVKVDQGYLYPILADTATVTVKVNGVTYADSATVTVKKATAEAIPASAQAGDPLSFSSLVSQLRSQCTNVLGSGYSLSYVSGLSVPTDQGTLYYRYASEADTGSGVGTGDRFYVSPGTGQMDLAEITFVPKEDFGGKAVISYTGYANGTTFFQGTIEVSVAQQQDVAYSVTGQKAVQFNADDFAQVCHSRTGRDLRSITFSLPDSSRGTLYYGYLSPQNPGTPVSVTGEYKYSGTPNLGDVYFLPAAGTSGEVVFPYTARDVNGDSYRGRVTIQVSAAAASGDISYSVTQGGSITFNDTDFNNLSYNLMGYALDYVRFTLPSSSQGTLYYNYTSSGNYTALVSESRDYYRSSYPYIDSITFVAAQDYAGTVTIPFTAWDTRGNRFYGEVGIAVSSKSGSGTLRYATFQGGTITFDDDDFNDLSIDLTGSSLRYVRFTLPSSSRGTLYYKYTSSGSYDSKVSENRSYYRSSTPGWMMSPLWPPPLPPAQCPSRSPGGTLMARALPVQWRLM